MLTPAQVLDRSVGAFVDALVQAGVRDVSACPGSRSTPLAIKLAEHPDVRLWMHLDERSSARPSAPTSVPARLSHSRDAAPHRTAVGFRQHSRHPEDRMKRIARRLLARSVAVPR